MLLIKNSTLLATKSILFIIIVLVFLSLLPEASYAAANPERYCGTSANYVFDDYYYRDPNTGELTKKVYADGVITTHSLGLTENIIINGAEYIGRCISGVFYFQPLGIGPVVYRSLEKDFTASVPELIDTQTCGSDTYVMVPGTRRIWKFINGSGPANVTSNITDDDADILQADYSTCVLYDGYADFYVVAGYYPVPGKELHKSLQGQSSFDDIARVDREDFLENSKTCGDTLYFNKEYWSEPTIGRSKAGEGWKNERRPSDARVDDGVCSCGNTFYFQNSSDIYKWKNDTRDFYEVASGNINVVGAQICSATTNNIVFGCTDSGATNYNYTATQSDDSCDYSPIPGCIYIDAINYNSSATVDDDSCFYSEEPSYCSAGYQCVEESCVQEFAASCLAYPSPTSQNAQLFFDTGEDVYWKSTTVGGQSPYSYTWTGDANGTEASSGPFRVEPGGYSYVGGPGYTADLRVVDFDGLIGNASCSISIKECNVDSDCAEEGVVCANNFVCTSLDPIFTEDLDIDPIIVNEGQQCELTWEAVNVVSCEVYGNGELVDINAPLSALSGYSVDPGTYNVQCNNGTGGVVNSKSVTCFSKFDVREF